MNTATKPLDRLLRVFAPVKGGEGSTVLIMASNVFLLMTAYYIIKPVREALILADWGAEAKIYASAGQAILLLGVVPLYSRLAGMMNTRRLISTVLIFFASCLALFYVLAQFGLNLGLAFYLWVGIFNVMVVAQFWSFANDFYTPEEGKRLFALIGFGMSAGAVFGSVITGMLIKPLGLYQLMLLSALLLIFSLLLTLFVARRRVSNKSIDSKETAAEPDKPLTGRSGFSLVMANRYLLLIGLMMILANLVNTTGEYILGSRVAASRQAAVPEVVRTDTMSEAAYELAVSDRSKEVGIAIGDFYADFFSIVNLVGLLAQLFLVSRLIGLIGVRGGLLVLPILATGSYLVMGIFPILAVTRWAKSAENATDYSLQNTVRNMLFLPTTRDEKYKAKQAIDTFFVRMGDVAAALLVLLGTTVFSLTTTGFALANVGLGLLWVALAVAIGRRYKALSGTS
jgi:AAA family ATP:ADP antiporter